MSIVEKFRKLPASIIILHISGKFLFGVGLGALLAIYLYRCNWQLWGWVIIVIAVLIQIPGAYKVLKK
ncbi:hypothetical protein HQ584_13130 [Patescibacteria group bacterium]|nr:hypothetical protein [Patescibacteria group bacterium]